MSEQSTVSGEQLDTLLVRLREACLFLIKADALGIGALATLATIFKLEGAQALLAASELNWVLRALGLLLTASLALWGFLVVLRVDQKQWVNVLVSWAGRILFLLLVMAHTLSLSYATGFVFGYLESMRLRL
jgi:uncharacterized membrane protein